MPTLLLSGNIIAWFLSVVLLTKRGRVTHDYLLAFWLASMGYVLFGYSMVYSGAHIDNPTLTVIGMPLPLMQGPFLFLYTNYSIRNINFQKIDLLHFLPVMFSFVVLFGSFFLLPQAERVEVFRQRGKGYETQLMMNLAGIYLSGLVYIPVTLRMLIRYRKNLKNEFSNTERIQFNWLLYLLIGIGIIWIVVWFISEDRFIYAATSVFVILLGYFGIQQADIFGHARLALQQEAQEAPDVVANLATTAKYQRSSLSDEMAVSLYEQLVQLMQREKPYLEPELTLGELAKLLNIHPNHLSQVINARADKNFYDFINAWRIEEFLRKADDPANQQFTLLALAFDCGFNSKASFNRNFRNYTGHAPTTYLKGRIEA
ncbi:MAG: AraC family transcriptional regulator [Saprospiraceae bacterium]|jgi:AraC-like DNA-binding protein|nr:AraC family transcriptional regulator [Saprospiraceae bacterium]